MEMQLGGPDRHSVAPRAARADERWSDGAPPAAASPDEGYYPDTLLTASIPRIRAVATTFGEGLTSKCQLWGPSRAGWMMMLLLLLLLHLYLQPSPAVAKIPASHLRMAGETGTPQNYQILLTCTAQQPVLHSLPDA